MLVMSYANAQEDRFMDRFLQLFGRFVQFSYATCDRIVLRGYYEAVQTLTNDNATRLRTKLSSGFAPQGATPVTRRPTSRPLNDYASQHTSAFDVSPMPKPVRSRPGE